MTKLTEPVRAITARRDAYKEASDYYKGEVPEVFATARLRKAFRVTGDRSRLNFCRPVVDAVHDRLEISNISAGEETATALIAQVWRDNDLGMEVKEVHRNALIYGDAYVMVWPDEEGAIQISYNSPLEMTLVYDPENPRRKLYAVKMWRSGENEHKMNIYTADSIAKYRANTSEVQESTEWSQYDSIENPFGEVPVFHFRTERPFGRPEHYDAYDSQNAINKLFITNMFTIDYQGAPQRYALSHAGDGELADYDDEGTERENIGALRNGPGELWYLKGIHTVGEFKPADADVFWGPIDKLRHTIAVLTKTPVHYLAVNNMGQPTGQSLRVAESPLLKKVHDRQTSFGYTWREVFRFILKISNVEVPEVIVLWQTHESLDELERWDVALKKINSGLSHKQALREGGYTEEQIEQIMSERDEEAANNQYYQRAPVTRVNTEKDETHSVPTDADNGKEE